jgi:hypothetical protein
MFYVTYERIVHIKMYLLYSIKYEPVVTNFVVGRYDTTQLVLKWEVESPVTAALNDNSWVPYLTEYKLLKIIPHSSEHYVEPIALDPTSSKYTYLGI